MKSIIRTTIALIGFALISCGPASYKGYTSKKQTKQYQKNKAKADVNQRMAAAAINKKKKGNNGYVKVKGVASNGAGKVARPKLASKKTMYPIGVNGRVN